MNDSVNYYSEPHAVSHHAERLAALGTRALIVTGRHSARANGSLADVTAALEHCGRSWVLFDRVEENPSVETVMAAREVGVREGCDFVIGIGGGSPMDAAKAIALMIRNADRDAGFLYEKPEPAGPAAGSASSGSAAGLNTKPQTAACPVAAVPTTCGTGSEATGVSVLTRRDLETKKSIPYKIFPDLALIDPLYLAYAPQSVLCNTAIDAMGHLLESYINTASTEESRAAALAGLRTWSRGKDVILGKKPIRRPAGGGVNGEPAGGPARGTVKDPAGGSVEVPGGEPDAETLETLTSMAEASFAGGRAIAVTGTLIPHALSYRLTCAGHVPHGRAIGVYQPAYLACADEADRAAVLEAMGFESLEAFAAFIRTCCRLETVTEEAYRAIAAQAVEDLLRDEARLRKVPFATDRAVLERIAHLGPEMFADTAAARIEDR